MSWLNKKRKTLSAGDKKTNGNVPDNLWQKDPISGQMVHHDELKDNFFVFPSGAHMRIGPKERFSQLFDNGQYKILPHPRVTEDPLNFTDLKSYKDRLTAARTGESPDALVSASGTIGGKKSVVACFDFYFMAGTMGQAVGEAFYEASLAAIKDKAAFITVTSSGGARMQEGVLSLMQLPRTIIGIQKVREAKLPYIVILADPTTGGVTASLAMLGDVHIAEQGAVIGFAGRRVIEQTTRATLPKDFQTAEFLEKHGVIDMVVVRQQLTSTLGKVLNFLMK
ncbi:MAG: acetyl-CoA carboxylase carboxyltransferase subunit beta [Hydrotalea sp.]|nr:acetyl-CoA carboxylase carboxyltransferase subunit beta [Hydrotalea sp.]